MSALPYAAAAIFIVLGMIHLVYTILDATREPRYFGPKDRSVLSSLRATHMALAPAERNYWDAGIGFHFSHSIGVLLLALLIGLANGTAGLEWLRPILIGVAAIYSLIAWRYWFRTPFAGCVAATGLLIAGWALPIA